MDEPNQSYEQKIERKKWEFSKKLTLFNAITYVFLMIACLAAIVFTENNGTFLKEIVISLTTTQIAMQALYFGKAGVENFQKIKAALKNDEQVEDDLG